MKKNLLYWLSICILHVHSYIYLAPHIPTKKVTRDYTLIQYSGLISLTTYKA